MVPGGDDAGVCLMNGRIYYSCFFGRIPKLSSGRPGPQGITAAIGARDGRDPLDDHQVFGPRRLDDLGLETGVFTWAGTTPLPGSGDCHVWCLDAKDGALVWQSEPVALAIHVVTIRPAVLFVHAQYQKSYVLDLATGKVLAVLDNEYKCTRLTLSGSTLIGTAMDVYDFADVEHVIC